MYPTKMEANGNIYDINTDYRIAFACLKAINDESITDLERFYAVEGLLLGTEVLFSDEIVLKEKISNYLRCGKKENTKSEEIDMDYFQDEEDIRTSIKQVYNGLDIGKIGYLHWYEYNELIRGLTSECIFERIRSIRNINENDIADEKERKKIIEIKNHLSLKKTDKKVTKEQMKNQESFFTQAGIKI